MTKHNNFRQVVRYGLSKDAWTGFEQRLRSLLETTGAKDVCELGGGANPTLNIDYVTTRGVRYSILDISRDELAKAPPGYDLVQADVTDPALDMYDRYDLVFSKMLAEHVNNARRFHSNVHKMLRPGGVAFHFFPPLYAFPFILNRLFPEQLAERLLNILQPGIRAREGRKAKFPAFYDWCLGPTDRQFARFESLGYDILEYTGYFGHSNYYRRLPPLQKASQALSGFLLKHPLSSLTSFAYLVIRKK